MDYVCDERSPLYALAEANGLLKLTIPEPVGGRYSVLSAVGLLPLFLSGVSLKGLLNGARSAVKACVKDSASNPAIISAGMVHEAYRKKGIGTHNTFLFNPELESIGKWYRQLMGESVGKLHDIKGREVRAGITPIVTVGSVDMHSMVQLLYGGPRDKVTNFIFARPTRKVRVPSNSLFSGIVKGLGGKTYEQIMRAIMAGNTAAYAKNKQLNATFELPNISESSLGYYLQFRMIEMMYIAKLMGVSAFDQPSVEDYKSVTRRRLR